MGLIREAITAVPAVPMSKYPEERQSCGKYRQDHERDGHGLNLSGSMAHQTRETRRASASLQEGSDTRRDGFGCVRGVEMSCLATCSRSACASIRCW
jgi:hypothetical protein